MTKGIDHRAVVLLLVIFLTASAVHSGERSHRVRAGDSASSIAKKYYGSFDATDLLLRYNGRSDAVIRPGEKLRIPYCDTHVVRPGDTWSVLAERYLGEADAYPAIAALNDLDPKSALQVGQTLVMPVVLSHPLAAGESLSSLSKEFYGTTDLASVLGKFNDIDDPRRLSVGQTIRVPLMTLRLAHAEPSKTTAKKTEAAPEVASEPPAPPKPRFVREMEEIREAFERGEYARARGMLDALAGLIDTSPSKDERREFWVLNAFVHVAFDEDAQACAAYGRSGAENAGTSLDPDRVSPKIRGVLENCS
ncbi:MAG: LysM peptidoglycan-binding domain-containing protein [Acidobacteriota bacterium]|nr:LysM peptidoglycan-binding domain-containing protein [Acidobacteriota bacterium]